MKSQWYLVIEQPLTLAAVAGCNGRETSTSYEKKIYITKIQQHDGWRKAKACEKRNFLIKKTDSRARTQQPSLQGGARARVQLVQVFSFTLASPWMILGLILGPICHFQQSRGRGPIHSWSHPSILVNMIIWLLQTESEAPWSQIGNLKCVWHLGVQAGLPASKYP